MKPQPKTIELDPKKLTQALNLVIDEQNFSKLRKQRMKRRLHKLMKQDRFELSNLGTEWLYRLCSASLMLREYNWLAWEWRSKWASELATRQWVYPRWDGDNKKRLLVVGEQGIGDEIVFSSCYNDLAKDVEEAWIECDPRLIKIFSRSFPDNLHFVSRFMNDERRIVPRMNDYPEFHKEYGIEAFIMAGNVPKLYRRCREDFPARTAFLFADAERYYYFKDWLKGEKVGCSWKGRQGDIERIKEGVSLQYGENDHGALRIPQIDLKWDIDSVFALASALEKVVTTTNAVAHIAGSVGTQTDVIKPEPIFATKDDMFNNRVQPWWPYDKSDWYPSVRMYRNFNEWKAKNKISIIS